MQQAAAKCQGKHLGLQSQLVIALACATPYLQCRKQFDTLTCCDCATRAKAYSQLPQTSIYSAYQGEQAAVPLLILLLLFETHLGPVAPELGW